MNLLNPPPEQNSWVRHCFNPKDPVWKPKNCKHNSQEHCPSPCHDFIKLYHLATSRSWRHMGLIMGQFWDWILFGLFVCPFMELLYSSLLAKWKVWVYEYSTELSKRVGLRILHTALSNCVRVWTQRGVQSKRAANMSRVAYKILEEYSSSGGAKTEPKSIQWYFCEVPLIVDW